jgi:hypothetical protein
MNQRTVVRQAARVSLVLAVLFSGAAPLSAAPDDWAEGAPGHNDGANHTYYNRAGQLPWRNRQGDWRDADGTQQGNKPFASAVIVVKKDAQPVEWDVTGLARDWASGKVRHKGLLLRNTRGSGHHRFHSRESDEADTRPRLILVANGKPRAFEAVADTHLVRSTVRGQGNSKELAVDGTLPALVRFDLGDLTTTDRIDRATLRLVAFKQYQ